MSKPLEVKWEDIRILSTEEVETYPQPGKKVIVLAVTYVYKDFPPRTIWIDKDKYTRDNLLKMVKADLERIIGGPMLPVR